MAGSTYSGVLAELGGAARAALGFKVAIDWANVSHSLLLAFMELLKGASTKHLPLISCGLGGAATSWARARSPPRVRPPGSSRTAPAGPASA